MSRPTQFQKLSLQLDAENKRLKAKLAATKKDFGGLGKQAQMLGGYIAGAFAVGRITDFLGESRKLAAELEGVGAAFKRLGGDRYMDDLKKATANTVSELNLMKAAVQAQNLGLPIKNLSSLFEFATKRAQDTGESVDYLVDSIVRGIGRKSPLILDNLGISAIQLRKELKGVGMETASVADVAAAVGRIAQTEMAKAGPIIETSAIKTAQWGATFDNLKTSVGAFINEGLNKIAPAVDKAIPFIEKLTEGIFGGKRGYLERSIKNYKDNFDELTSEEQIAQAEKWKAELDKLTVSVFNLKRRSKELKDENPMNNSLLDSESWASLNNQADEYQKKIDIIEGVLSEINKKPLEEDLTGGQVDLAPAGPYKYNSKTLGTEMAVQVEEEFNKQLEDELDLKEELAKIDEQRLDSIKGFNEQLFGGMPAELADSLNAWNHFLETKDTVLQGWVSIADVVQQTAAGIGSAKDNWAAMASVAISGLAKITPLIQEQIGNIRKLMVAKKAEGVAGAIASGASQPFPMNLIAIASGVATVLSTIAPFVGSFARGTDYVPKTGMAMVHKGEKITPRGQGGSGVVEFVLRGENLYGSLTEYSARRGNRY